MADIELLARLSRQLDDATRRQFFAQLPADLREEVLLRLHTDASPSINTSMAGTETRSVSHEALKAGHDSPEDLATSIGRYRVLQVLGKGAFGRVYLAVDDQLERKVAIKIPVRSDLNESQSSLYFREAQILAQLDHPNIVPVYDVFATDDHPCVIVSKFIVGRDLRTRLEISPISHNEAAQLVATVATALHHAHKRGLVHRDIKPANILLDELGNPYLADFGLAHHDVDWSDKQTRSGTPLYMSPEQASGRGGMVDGRSDVFSLGAVLYEMLAGQPPFVGKTPSEITRRIISGEAKPPRQINDGIPRELERICLKALANNLAERYTTALDFAEDLHAATTYSPKPIDTSKIKLTAELADTVELLAQNCHDVWAAKRITDGWEFGNVRDDQNKRHPDLIPYAILPEPEKDYDRVLVEGILKTLLALGYRIDKIHQGDS